MISSHLSTSTFVAVCTLLSTHVAQTLAVPLARTSDPKLQRPSSSISSEIISKSSSDTDSQHHALTSRQVSSSSAEVFVYYGQVLPTTGADLSDICADPNIDKVALAFVTSFADSAGYPILSIGKNCPSTNPAQTAAGATGLHDCVASGLAKKVAACQQAGKPVLLSLGGGAATEIAIPSQDAAQRYAHSLWDLFLGNVGNEGVRPFGSVILDGIDIDIEHGSGAYLIDFVIALRKLMDASTASTGRRYYITAAPQCSDLITPTSAVQATTIPWLTLAPYLDSVLVQFYNNPTCDFTSTSLFMSSLSAWSEALAKTIPVSTSITSTNFSIANRPNYKVVSVDGLTKRSVQATPQTSSKMSDKAIVSRRDSSFTYPKLLIGASATSEVGSGYLPIADLAQVLKQVSTKTLPNLGGVMFWDGVWCMSQSSSVAGDQLFHQAAKSALSQKS